jgi:hypothetical protein
MGFLDNLENDLKALEGREEFANRAEENRIRDEERVRALAAAPFAERLKSGAFTEELLKQATHAGYAARTKVHMTWLGTTLRLEARDRKLDLRPTADGVLAVFLQGADELRSSLVDLDGSPAALVSELLGPKNEPAL